jgi:phage terminase large subunit-like protein
MLNDPTQLSRAEQMALWPRRERDLFFMSLSRAEPTLSLGLDLLGRPKQQQPPGDWSVWLAMAGRGFGKTRLGAEWVRSMVCDPHDPKRPGKVERIALIGETAADVRDVMVKGNGGILATHPPEFRPVYLESKRRLEWPNGAIALTFSAEEPDQLRGPEHDLAWCDELAKWRYAQETWDMLQFGLRLGDHPRVLVTTTPRPIDLVRDLLKGVASGETAVTHGSTYDNASNLSAKFIENVRRKYEGSRLGRQELHAELLDDVPGALWTRLMLDKRGENNPKGAGLAIGESLPQLRRIVVGVDPSGSTGENVPKSRSRQEGSVSDLVGIIVAGVDYEGGAWLLEDATSAGGPAEWALPWWRPTSGGTRT